MIVSYGHFSLPVDWPIDPVSLVQVVIADSFQAQQEKITFGNNFATPFLDFPITLPPRHFSVNDKMDIRTAKTAIRAKRQQPSKNLNGNSLGRAVKISNFQRRTVGLAEQALSLLPPKLRQQLSRADRKQVLDNITRLENLSSSLDFLPVFGYLSLRSDNYRELGKTSQGEVVPGQDFVGAVLPSHGLDFIASTVYRGTPEHPGVVAGLSAREGVDTPGVLLKVPKNPKCVAEILKREFFAESDLRDSDGLSNSMYRPYLKTITLEDGTRQQALVFLTNQDSAKAISVRQNMTAELLGWLMAGEGGFLTKGGDDQVRGGPCWSYWKDSYLEPRRKKGEPIEPVVEKALELAKFVPGQEVLNYIDKREDESACLMSDALLHLFDGVSIPLTLRTLQKPQAEQQITRLRREQRPLDLQGNALLELARELQGQGHI